MGEVDTKPFESVQTAISLFGPPKSFKKGFRTNSVPKYSREVKDMEFEQKKLTKRKEEIKLMHEELINQKMLAEITEALHLETLLQLEVYNAMLKDLSTQFSQSEIEKEKCMAEITAAETQVALLKSENKQLQDDLLQHRTTNEGLQLSINRLGFVRVEMKLELKASEEAKRIVLTQVEELGEALGLEKMKVEELFGHVNELNGAILASNWAAIEAEKDKTYCLLAKDEKLQIAQDEIEELKAQLDLLGELENQQHANSDLSESLQLELEQSKEQTSNAMQESERLNQEMKLIREQIEVNDDYIHSMETELAKTRENVKQLRKENDNLNDQIDSTSDELKTLKNEVGLVEQRESQAQVEIAELKAELHQSRSKIATLEADEARGQYIKSGLYLAVQELAKEAEQAKKKLKEKVEGPTITISIDEYDWLVKEANNPDPVELDASNVVEWNDGEDRNKMNEELEAAKEEIERLRNDVEGIRKRAEEAEEVKRVLEEQMRKYRKHKEKRRAAIEALKESSIRWVNKPPSAPETVTGPHKPLGKVLKMKF